MRQKIESQSQAAIRSHIPALDGVRGLAVLLVLATHLLQSNSSTGNRFFDTVNVIREATWIGVDLFFVLSGFLITGILFDSVSSEGYFKNFYVRRVLRIFPLYYGFIILLLCLTHPLHLHWDGMQYVLLTYTQNLFIFGSSYSFKPSPFINLTHFWSLAVEEQFYLFWPLIVFLVRDVRKLIVTAVTLSLCALAVRIVLAVHGAPTPVLYELICCRADSLMIGGILALMVRTAARNAVVRYSAPAFVVGFLLLVGIGVYLHGMSANNRFVQTAGFSMLAMTFAALIGSTVARPAWTRMAFENRVMRFFGKYSYGIYVFHVPLNATLMVPLRHWLGATLHSKAIAVGLGGIFIALITVAVAVLSYELYEKRFLKLKRYFEPQRPHASGP